MDTPLTGITTQGRAACPTGSCSDHSSISKYNIGVLHDAAPSKTLGSSTAANEKDDEELSAWLCSFEQNNTSSGTLQAADVLHAFQCLETAPAPSTEPLLQQHHLCLPSHHPASHVKASNMPSPHDIQPPPRRAPPAYPNLHAQVFGAASACAGALSEFMSGTTSGSPADADNFTFPYLDIKQKNQVPPCVLYPDRYKLTSPIPVPWHTSPRSGHQPTLDVPTSSVDNNRGDRSWSTFLAFTRSESLSPAASFDSASTGFSTRSMPIMLPNNNVLQPHELGRANLSMPTSPSLSANKAEGLPSTSKKESKSSAAAAAAAAAGHVVVFKVKTNSADLDDGYQWLKYGEKPIKNEKYRRSYFRCNKKKGWGCEVQKHTLKCTDDEECFTITYLGRHRHPRGEQNTLATRKRDRPTTRKLGKQYGTR